MLSEQIVAAVVPVVAVGFDKASIKIRSIQLLTNLIYHILDHFLLQQLQST